jgi:chloramphenicol O-acetyltransferase type A
MRYLDMAAWPRREHFKLFNAYEHPHFGITANVDLTAFYPVVKQRGISFTAAMVYVISRASNAIAEFRYRIRAGKVAEHEIVHPSFTILVGEDVFSFCTIDYVEDFPEFAAIAAKGIEDVKEHLTLEDDPDRDDLLFMTAIPWVSFTSFRAPMLSHPGDSIPRYAWGKFIQDGESLKMPLCVEVHHALIDGAHVGKFYTQVQDFLQQPEVMLGEA